MQKRVYDRLPANVDVKFFYGNMFYSGIITNLSEHGMFIRTRRCLPFESKFEIFFHLKDDVLKVPAKVTRIVKTDVFFDGMGVELFNQPAQYLEFVNSFKAKEFSVPLRISDETLKQTTHCQRNFHCLTNNGNMCLIDKPISERGLLIKEIFSNNENCPYIESSENAFICNCPTRNEVYMRYNF